jgi:hypothetical protein
MTERTHGVALGSWLAELPDEDLIHLLELRPDLAQPPPGSIAALAARAQARQSVRAATDELDFLRLAVIDALLVLHADTVGVPITKLFALIGERAPEAEVVAALDDLRSRALCWGDSVVQVVAEAGAGLPWHPGQVTLEDTSRTAEQITAAIAEIDDPQRDLLEKLLAGSPLGRTRDAAPGAPPDRPVPRLLAAGLLRQVDDETVILPRAVGQVLRYEQPDPVQLVAPGPAISQTTPGRRCRRRGCCHRPAARVQRGPRHPQRRARTRTTQRWTRDPRAQAAGQGNRYRRIPAGPALRDCGRGRADRGRRPRSGAVR